MSRATFTFGRFNPPTETGHGKLVKAVQDHAEETGGSHYIFPSHTQDKKKNPLSHEEKVGAMRSLFPKANVVSNEKVKTAIDAMKHLESKGHTHVTMVVGSDRVAEFHGLLSKYRKKEFPGIKKVEVKSAGSRDPDAEGAEGESASKHRALVAAGKRDEFIKKYSDRKLGAHIHDRVKAGMQMESVNPVGIFLIGGPGSGKDYVLSNIFSRFDLTEVQIDHILNGSADELLEQKRNIVINGSIDEEKIAVVSSILEEYNLDYVYVSVTNKVSRLRNGLRDNPLAENKRIEKWLRAEQLAESFNCFKFNNSINLNESSDLEKVFFADQIEKLLARIVDHGLELQSISEAKTFAPVAKHKSGLPKKYVSGLSDTTAAARKAHWKKMSKYSDRDPRAYKPAPGDVRAKTKLSKYTKKYRAMYGEQVQANVKHTHSVEDIAAKHKVAVADIIQALSIGKQVEREHTNDERTAEIIALAHLWEKPDYYTLLAKMEQKVPPTIKVTDADHQAAERRNQIIRDRRDLRILHHQNRHIHQAAKGSMSEAEDKSLPVKLRRAPRSGNITAIMDKRRETGRVDEGAADSSLTAKSKKSGIPLTTLRKVYNRGVAAWNSGHRPGTTPQQWGHARVNSYITKGKTYYTADKDLREETKITGTNCKNCIHWVKESVKSVDKSELNENGGLKPTSDAYIAMAKHADLVSLPGKATVKEKAFCNHEDIQDFVTERMCCAYWDNEDAERPFKGKADIMEGIDDLFEMQLVGTDAYRKHAIAMTPGQKQEIEDAFPVKDPSKKNVEAEREYDCGCEDECDCKPTNESSGFKNRTNLHTFNEKENDGKENGVDFTPTVSPKKLKKGLKTPGNMRFAYLDGLPVVTARVTEGQELDASTMTSPPGFEYKSAKPLSKIRKSLPMPRQVPAPPDGHPVPPGYKRVKDHIAGWKLVKEENTSELTLQEAVQYHTENNISFTRNVFRPGSSMFFELIGEAKKLYREGKYTPADEYEVDMLNSDIGDVAEYNGQLVVLDYPVEEGLEESCWKGYVQKGLKKKGDRMVPNCVPVSEEEQIEEDRAWTHEDEYGMHMDAHADAMAAGNYEKAEIHAKKAEAAAAKHFKTTGEKIRDAGYTGKSTHIVNEEDKTDGKGIGKPWREGGGGAVYVRTGDGIRKISFSKSGMKKKYMDPAATRSFVARHRCLTNKDRTSASYWACRWPRFFSDSGKVWW